MQQFLQDAYLNMWEVVIKTLAGLDCVVGFDVGPLSRILYLTTLRVPLPPRNRW